MAKERRPFVIGLFPEDNQAKQAINDLQRGGWQEQQMLFAHGGSTRNQLPADLIDMGVPEGEIHLYEQELASGHSLVVVLAGDRYQEVVDILVGRGASNLNQQTSQKNVHDAEDNVKVPLREERLRVNKHSVESGEATLSKEVVSERQTFDVPVTHEEVYVEHRPLKEQLSTTPIGEDETVRVPVKKEQVHVSKQSVETGEVSIGKRRVQEKKTVSDTVKREEPRIERVYNEDVQARENNP